MPKFYPLLSNTNFALLMAGMSQHDVKLKQASTEPIWFLNFLSSFREVQIMTPTAQ